MDSTSRTKHTLRAELRRERELSFTPESWLHIVQAREIQSTQIVASYASYGFEPQTVDINAALIHEGKILLLPRTMPDKDIEWVAWDGSDESLQRNGNILEPLGETYTDLSSIGAVIVPALSIDREGNRMGQGGGSYDRALSRLDAWKVGLVGATELTGHHLPVESHDQKVDAAATPELLLRFSRDAPGHL
ncbi:MAG: 5-formyltetrahydrofolate cyclo-ligase [Actinomycetes bacterium]